MSKRIGIVAGTHARIREMAESLGYPRVNVVPLPAHSASDLIRGRTLDVLLIDEPFATSDLFELDDLTPALIGSGGPTYVLSQP
ncbi:hypothetical protein BI023_gp64 [Mycobacterium phage Sneeze]|uniref:Uncharacterized protein n=1 Tax=Mycobacterium phage Rabbs TaxID=2530143 RepID=A0A481VSH5_9CAUD|nr:hypothetical protein BI023_gp64 [Mycobacterium phage Sneeze]YP_010051410.1 hypothetical protein KDW71_gp65 [Mycobacterium phage Rabbs]ANU79769.1 hypothetical protein SEA_SNEEZE_64 [Mycobacterium phage Sneeze]QBI96816.1 hypothetical protein SEA_RABBS_65 [Mycobacterium phage Rabbs]